MVFNFALPHDEVFQRKLAKWVRSRTPVSVETVTEHAYTGWITGLDDETIQLCHTGNFLVHLISRQHVVNISEHKLAISLTELQKEELDQFTHRMVEVAKKALEGK